MDKPKTAAELAALTHELCKKKAELVGQMPTSPEYRDAQGLPRAWLELQDCSGNPCLRLQFATFVFSGDDIKGVCQWLQQLFPEHFTVQPERNLRYALQHLLNAVESNAKLEDAVRRAKDALHPDTVKTEWYVYNWQTPAK